MTDRTTKTLLFAIALGLWVHIATSWFAAVPLGAQDAQLITSIALGRMSGAVETIQSDVRGLVNGVCLNKTLCGR